MKASELRIGNFITEAYKEDPEIIKIDGDSISFLDKTDCRNMRGVPLTEDWLVKFGFKDDRIMLTGDGELEIKLKGSTFHVWPTDGQTESHNYRHLIQYVHQLQNIYHALTGEELTIKEPAV